MIPELDLARVHRWVEAHNTAMPPAVRDELRFEVDVSDRAVTVLECRPPWQPGAATDTDTDDEWTRFPICRFRYTKVRREWSLYWRDRNLKFHRYDPAAPTPHLQELIDHVDDDRNGIFWG